MAAGKYDLALEAGSLFEQSIIWKPGGVTADLTNYTAKLQVRRDMLDEEPIIDLTSETGGLTLGGVLGTILIRITATQTAALQASYPTDRLGRLGRYDLELIPPSGAANARRILEGRVTLSMNVTR